jgi:hypothetical protein
MTTVLSPILQSLHSAEAAPGDRAEATSRCYCRGLAPIVGRSTVTTNLGFIVSVVIGDICLLTVCSVYLRKQSFKLDGLLLSICGVVLLGMVNWQARSGRAGPAGPDPTAWRHPRRLDGPGSANRSDRREPKTADDPVKRAEGDARFSLQSASGRAANGRGRPGHAAVRQPGDRGHWQCVREGTGRHRFVDPGHQVGAPDVGHPY